MLSDKSLLQAELILKNIKSENINNKVIANIIPIESMQTPDNALDIILLHANSTSDYQLRKQLGLASKPSTTNVRRVIFETPRTTFLDIYSNKSLNYHICWDETIKAFNNLDDLEIIKIFLLKSNSQTIALLTEKGHLSIDLLRNVKDIIDWQIITNLNYFIYNLEFLNEFKEYLIFTTLPIKEGKYQKKLISNFVQNFKGQRYTSSFSKRCLSSSNHVLWSESLIESLTDYWDWDVLSSSSHIKFTKNLIYKFAEKWNWELLSANKSIYWNKPLVETFIQKIDASTICLNSNVDWYNVLPILVESSELQSKLLWELISNNPGLDVRLINEKYPLVFKADYSERGEFFHYTGGIMQRLNTYPLVATYNKSQHFYTEAAGPLTLHLMPSLSSNTRIVWTDELLSTYKDILDFWMIALRGNISSELVIKYASYFNINRYTHSTYRKHSDWGTFEIYHFHTCWDNILCNPNFNASAEFLNWSREYKVKTIDSYDTYFLSTPVDLPPSAFIEESNDWVYLLDIIKSGPTYRLDYSLL